jgi:hypothetical protein
MGYLSKGVCYPSSEAVQADFCSNYGFTWSDANGQLYSRECVPQNANSELGSGTLIVCQRLNGGECAQSMSAYPAFADCNFSGSSDLAYEWFLMAFGLLVVVWGGKQLIKLFEGKHDEG